MQEIPSNINWSATAAMIAASVAFFSLIISPIVAYKIAKKQISSTILLNERKEWINALQSDVSSFAARAVFLSNDLESTIYTFENSVKFLEDFFSLQVKIQLKLNPSINSHKDLEELVYKISNEFDNLASKPSIHKSVVKYVEGLVPLTRIVIQEELKQIRYLK